MVAHEPPHALDAIPQQVPPHRHRARRCYALCRSPASPSRCPRACGDPSPSPAQRLLLGSRGRQSIFRPSSLPLLPSPFPLSSRMRGPIPVPRTEPPGKTGTTIHLSSQLPSVTPATPSIVLADAGTHPPQRACPREDGDDNPSFVPAPFRYSIVLADAGTHPHPPQRASGDDNPSFVPAPFHSRPLSRMRGPIPVPRKEPALGKTGTTIHLSSQLPSDLLPHLPHCPRGCGDPSPSPAKSLPLGRRGRQSIFRPSSLPLLPPPLPLSSRMRGPIFPTPPHHPQPALGASLAGALPVPVPIRPPSPPSYSFPLTFRRRRGRRNASYTATQSSIDVLPTASPINSNGRSSSFRNRTQDFPMFIRFPVAL